MGAACSSSSLREGSGTPREKRERRKKRKGGDDGMSNASMVSAASKASNQSESRNPARSRGGGKSLSPNQQFREVSFSTDTKGFEHGPMLSNGSNEHGAHNGPEQRDASVHRSLHSQPSELSAILPLIRRETAMFPGANGGGFPIIGLSSGENSARQGSHAGLGEKPPGSGVRAKSIAFTAPSSPLAASTDAFGAVLNSMYNLNLNSSANPPNSMVSNSNSHNTPNVLNNTLNMSSNTKLLSPSFIASNNNATAGGSLRVTSAITNTTTVSKAAANGNTSTKLGLAVHGRDVAVGGGSSLNSTNSSNDAPHPPAITTTSASGSGGRGAASGLRRGSASNSHDDSGHDHDSSVIIDGPLGPAVFPFVTKRRYSSIAEFETTYDKSLDRSGSTLAGTLAGTGVGPTIVGIGSSSSNAAAILASNLSNPTAAAAAIAASANKKEKGQVVMSSSASPSGPLGTGGLTPPSSSSHNTNPNNNSNSQQQQQHVVFLETNQPAAGTNIPITNEVHRFNSTIYGSVTYSDVHASANTTETSSSLACSGSGNNLVRNFNSVVGVEPNSPILPVYARTQVSAGGGGGGGERARNNSNSSNPPPSSTTAPVSLHSRLPSLPGMMNRDGGDAVAAIGGGGGGGGTRGPALAVGIHRQQNNTLGVKPSSTSVAGTNSQRTSVATTPTAAQQQNTPSSFLTATNTSNNHSMLQIPTTAMGGKGHQLPTLTAPAGFHALGGSGIGFGDSTQSEAGSCSADTNNAAALLLSPRSGGKGVGRASIYQQLAMSEANDGGAVGGGGGGGAWRPRIVSISVPLHPRGVDGEEPKLNQSGGIISVMPTVSTNAARTSSVVGVHNTSLVSCSRDAGDTLKSGEIDGMLHKISKAMGASTFTITNSTAQHGGGDADDRCLSSASEHPPIVGGEVGGGAKGKGLGAEEEPPCCEDQHLNSGGVTSSSTGGTTTDTCTNTGSKYSLNTVAPQTH